VDYAFSGAFSLASPKYYNKFLDIGWYHILIPTKKLSGRYPTSDTGFFHGKEILL